MTDRQHDPEMLDEILGSYRNPWYGRGCAVGRMISDLDPGPFRSKMIAAMAASVDEIGHAAITRAIEQTIGITMRSDSLGRHRSRQCRCGPEVWE